MLTPEQALAKLFNTDLLHQVEKAYVHGTPKWFYKEHFDVVVEKDGKSKEVRFIRSTSTWFHTSGDTVLVEFPAGFVASLGLEDLVLDADEVERRREAVAVYNAPHLAPNRKPAEKVGSVRI